MAVIGRTLTQLDVAPLPLDDDHILAISNPNAEVGADVAYRVRIGDLQISPIDPDKINTKSIREDDGDVYYGSNVGNITVNDFRVGRFSDSRDHDDIEVGDVVFIGSAAPYADVNTGTVVEKLEDREVMFDSMGPASGADFEVVKTRLYIGRLDPGYFETSTGLSYISVGAKKTFIGGNVEVEEEIRTKNIIAPTVTAPEIESSSDMTMQLISGGTAQFINISTEAIVSETMSTGINIKTNSQASGGTISIEGRNINLRCTNNLELTANSIDYDAGDITFTSFVTFKSVATFDAGVSVQNSHISVNSGSINLHDVSGLNNLNLSGGASLNIGSGGRVAVAENGYIAVADGEHSYIEAPKILSKSFVGGSFKATDTELVDGTIETKDGDIKTTGSGNIVSAGNISCSAGGWITTTGFIQGGGFLATAYIQAGNHITADNHVEAPSVYCNSIKTRTTRPAPEEIVAIAAYNDNGLPSYPVRPTLFLISGQYQDKQIYTNNSIDSMLVGDDGIFMQKSKKDIDFMDGEDDKLVIKYAGVYEYHVNIILEEARWNGARFTLTIFSGLDQPIDINIKSFYHPAVGASDRAMISGHGYMYCSANAIVVVQLSQISGRDRKATYQSIYLKYDSASR